MSNNSVIKSYVWHGERCFFVSTIERESSAACNPCRYNETIVWEYDWANRERGEIMYQRERGMGSIRNHLAVCQELFDKGELDKEQP